MAVQGRRGSVGQLAACVAAHLGLPKGRVLNPQAVRVEHLPDVGKSLLLGRKRVTGEMVQVPAVVKIPGGRLGRGGPGLRGRLGLGSRRRWRRLWVVVAVMLVVVSSGSERAFLARSEVEGAQGRRGAALVVREGLVQRRRDAHVRRPLGAGVQAHRAHAALVAPGRPGLQALRARLTVGSGRRSGVGQRQRRHHQARTPSSRAQLAARRRRSQRHDILHAEARQPVGRASVVFRQRAVGGAGGRGGRASRAALKCALGAQRLHLGDDREGRRRGLTLDHHLLLGLLGGVR